MRRILIAITVSLMFMFGVALAKSMAHDIMSKSGETSTLLGAMVKNPQGEDLGNIADVVTGPEGQVAFAVIALWISDDTQKRVAIPFDALSCEGDDCVLNSSKDALYSAPAFVQKTTWLSLNWLERFTGTSAYNPTGQRKEQRSDG